MYEQPYKKGQGDVYIIVVTAKANADIPHALVSRAKRIVKTRLFDTYEFLPENEAEMKAIVYVLYNLQGQGAILSYRIERYIRNTRT